jgi:hypothetical protein
MTTVAVPDRVQPKNILSATDFSHAAASTLPFAAEIAFKGAGSTHEPSPINLNHLTRSEFSLFRRYKIPHHVTKSYPSVILRARNQVFA